MRACEWGRGWGRASALRLGEGEARSKDYSEEVAVRPVELFSPGNQEEPGRRIQPMKFRKEDLMCKVRFNLRFLLKSELQRNRKAKKGCSKIKFLLHTVKGSGRFGDVTRSVRELALACPKPLVPPPASHKSGVM